MSRFGSIVLLLVATVALATLPPGYMGDVLHIVFDGSGTWNEQLGSGPATASVRWHDEWDVTIPDLLMTFSQGGITGANDATMVSGSSTFPNPACSGPLVLNRSHGTPTPPGP